MTELNVKDDIPNENKELSAEEQKKKEEQEALDSAVNLAGKEFLKYVRERYFMDFIHQNSKHKIVDRSGNQMDVSFLSKVFVHWNYQIRSTPLPRNIFELCNPASVYTHLYAATSKQFIPKNYVLVNGQLPKFKIVEPVPDGDGAVIINTFRPFELAAQDCYQQPPQCWFDFLDSMFPETEEEGDLIKRTVVQFFAHLLKYPANRGSWSLMLPSEQGTGKGVLINKIIEPMIQGRVHTETSFGDLMKSFGTSAIADNLLVLIDDPKGQGATKEVHNALKSMISEPLIRVERKYETAFMAKAYARIVLASNYEVPFRLPEGDRRWFVTNKIIHQVDKETTLATIIRPLLDWLYPRELQQVPNTHTVYDPYKLNCLWTWFTEQDLSDFDSYLPPMTKAKALMMDASKTVDDKRFESFISVLNDLDCNAFHHDVVKTLFDLKGSINDQATNIIKHRLAEHGFVFCPKLDSKIAAESGIKGGQVWYKFSVLGNNNKKPTIKHTLAAKHIAQTASNLEAALKEIDTDYCTNIFLN